MSLLAIILLIILGLILLLLEFVVIPGVTIAGVGGFLLLAGSVYIAFAEMGKIAGFITLAVVLILSPLMVYYFFKSKAGKKMILDSKIDGKIVNMEHGKIQAGDIGITIGRLAPMGKIKINGEVVEAQSAGIYINEHTEIQVIKIHLNKIIVEPFNKE